MIFHFFLNKHNSIIWVCGKLWRDSGGNVTICIFQVKWDGWLQLILQWPLAKECSPAESSSRTLEQMRAIQSGCLCVCMWCFKYSLFMDLWGPLSLYRRRLYADESEWNTTGPFNICSRLCLIMQLRTPCLCIFTALLPSIGHTDLWDFICPHLRHENAVLWRQRQTSCQPLKIQKVVRAFPQGDIFTCKYITCEN